MRRPTAFLISLFVLLAAAAPAAAKSHRIDVPWTLAKRIDKARSKTDVPILLPSRYISERKKLYGSGGATDDGYAFGLAYIKGCGGANACDAASFYAIRGEDPYYKRTVRLTGGVTGYYKPLTCGASCADPEIQWIDDGVLYGISASAGPERVEKKRMVKLANSAIKHGPR
ncbi:MAG TPA: hypothetical protein VF533_16615 [Solirubrobacteraceae bacterium]|jgi:hypothetical protein